MKNAGNFLIGMNGIDIINNTWHVALGIMAYGNMLHCGILVKGWDDENEDNENLVWLLHYCVNGEIEHEKKVRGKFVIIIPPLGKRIGKQMANICRTIRNRNNKEIIREYSMKYREIDFFDLVSKSPSEKVEALLNYKRYSCTKVVLNIKLSLMKCFTKV